MPNLRSLLMLFYTIFCVLLALLGIVVDPTGHVYIWIARRIWAPALLRIGGIRLTVSGGENIDWSIPYVVVSNHASQIDIPAIFASLKMPVRFMAKKSLFYIPLFGWSLWFAKFIPVDRSSSKKARESINLAAKRISKGPSLIVFPEGTRSTDGNLSPFKTGAFVMAIKSDVPVLPIAIRGSYDIFPRSTLKMGSGPLEVIIGTPILTSLEPRPDKESLRQQAYAQVSAMLETHRPA